MKNKLASNQPFGDWNEKIVELNDKLRDVPETRAMDGADLRRRQVAAGYSIEEIEQVLAPMAEDGKEMIASMGDDTPSAVLSKVYRPLSHFFRQNFSQVTNPAIDSLREYRVMSLKTRFGNLKNVLDEESSQTEILVLDSPFVANGEFAEMVHEFGDQVSFIDCTFPAGGGEDALRDGLERIRAEAEDAVRSGAGHLVLTDEHQNADKVPMPMILATSAVHSWLTRKGLRTFCSINARSAECIDPHYFAVLIGSGATTVNAYLAQETIADRIDRGLIDGPLIEAMRRYRAAIDLGLLKIMSKMGISVISSYRGGLNFEAVGLSRAMVAEYFPGMPSRISGIGLHGIQMKLEEVHAKGWRGGQDVLPIGGFYKARRSGEKACLGSHQHASVATSLQQFQLCAVEAVFQGHVCARPDPFARPAGYQGAGPSDSAGRGGEHHLYPQALRHAGHVAWRLVARGAYDAEHCHEPHRREIRQRRGGAKTRHTRIRCPMVTTPAPRSSRWHRAGLA